MRRIAGIGVLLALTAPALAQVLPGPAPLIVVYGPEAPSREGDPDHVERLFISVPADLADRLYLRVFDPEPFGENDTRYGRSSAATTTTFRLAGGKAPGPPRRCRPGSPKAPSPAPRPTPPPTPPPSPAAASSPSAPSTWRAPPTASGSPSPPSPPPTAR